MPSAPLPTFAVVIASYNRQDLIRATLDSIFNQNPPAGGGSWSVEVIVVDDGSTDDSVAMIRREYGDRVKLMTQANQGPGAARHKGAATSTAEYITFLDSDDLWLPWTLQRYTEIIEKYDRPAFIAGKPALFREESQVAAFKDGPIDADYYADFYKTSHDWLWWGSSSLVVRGDAYRRVGGMTSAFISGEDTDLTIRLGVEKGFVHVKSPATFAYRENPIGSWISNVARNHAGVQLLIDTEKAGKYPGGDTRRKERLTLITRHTRWGSFLCLKGGDLKRAWGLYRDTAAWHLRLGKLKYLAGFPLVWAKTLVLRPEKKTHA